MPVCPLDFRYGRPEMKAIFDEENRLQRLLDVEAALAMAHAKVGNIKQDHADIVKKTASTRYVKLARVQEIDAKINHEITALIRALSEQCGESGKYVHVGATSNDILDTAAALQIKDAIDLLEKDHDFLLKGDVFTPDLIETWIDYKRKNEVDPIRLRPHPYEFALYYDI